MFYQRVKPHIQQQSEQTYKRNQIIYNEGDQPEHLYFIISGMVGLFHISESGKETFFRVFGKDDIFGHRSFFSKEPYHASSIALSPVTLASISINECERICKKNPELVKDIAGLMAKDLGAAELRIAGLLDKTAHKRISESLVFLKLKHPYYVWTRKEIAEYSGSTFETVTRLMSILEKKNLIEKQGRDFQILDHEKLLSLNEQDLH
jgi:CRP-like cAMP-binding protein